LRLERHEGAYLLVGGPVPPGADAITVGRVVSVRAAQVGSPYLLAHELVHVRQYAERGLVGFLLRYLAGYVRLRLAGWPHRAAYRRLPEEVEADWQARCRLGWGSIGP
jgi:hypothetical protein